MIASLVIGVGLGRGLPLPYLGFLALASWFPWLAVAAALVIWLRERPATSADAEVAYLSGVAAQLGAGLSLRHALAIACDQAPALGLVPVDRAARAGQPLDHIAHLLGDRLPTQGVTAAAAIRLASRTGGPIAPVFETLASRAAADLDMRREIRTGTAAARFSALVIGGGPLVIVATAAARGGLSPLNSTVEGIVVLAGSLLVVFGSSLVWLMLRRAAR